MANVGEIVANTSHDNVINLVVDGVCPKGNRINSDPNDPGYHKSCVPDASVPQDPNGNVSGNTLHTPRGQVGLGCILTFDYTVSPYHKGDILLQEGFVSMTYDAGQCLVVEP